MILVAFSLVIGGLIGVGVANIPYDFFNAGIIDGILGGLILAYTLRHLNPLIWRGKEVLTIIVCAFGGAILIETVYWIYSLYFYFIIWTNDVPRTDYVIILTVSIIVAFTVGYGLKHLEPLIQWRHIALIGIGFATGRIIGFSIDSSLGATIPTLSFDGAYKVYGFHPFFLFHETIRFATVGAFGACMILAIRPQRRGLSE